MLEGNGYYLRMGNKEWNYIIEKSKEIDDMEMKMYQEEEWITRLCYEEYYNGMKGTYYEYEVRRFEQWVYQEMKEMHIQFMLALTIRWGNAKLSSLPKLERKYYKLCLFMRKFYWSRFREWMQVDIPGFVDEYEYEKMRKYNCLLYTSPSPRDLSTSRMPSSA